MLTEYYKGSKFKSGMVNDIFLLYEFMMDAFSLKAIQFEEFS